MNTSENIFQSFSPFSSRKQGEIKINGVNIFASGDVENVLINIARRFSSPIELAVYFIADNLKRLNLLVAPDPVLGIAGKEGHLQTKRNLDDLVSIEAKVTVRPGVVRYLENNSTELGVQIITSSEEFDDAKVHFVPLNELSLDRRLVQYFPVKSMLELFPGKKIEDVTDEDLKDLILNTRELKKLELSYFNGSDAPKKTVTFLQDYLLMVDMISSGRSLHPIPEFHLFVLDPVNNKFHGGGFYGVSHVHYGWTEEEIAGDEHLQKLREIDPRWVELITVFDGLQIISGGTELTGSNEEKVNARMAFLGVTALNPVNYGLIGTTYFDFVKLARSENIADYRRFISLVSELSVSTDYDLLREYYHLVRKYSSPYLPGYVAT